MPAAKKIILILALLLLGVVHAPAAVALDASANRTWEKIGASSQTHRAQTAQVPATHQENGPTDYDLTSGCSLAAETAEEMVTVTHFTNAETVAAIENGTGTLNPGSFVTLPGEVEGMSAAEVESALEIGPGKGAFSTTFETPASNLQQPFNGSLTSGGRIQFQLINPTTPGPFGPTP